MSFNKSPQSSNQHHSANSEYFLYVRKCPRPISRLSLLFIPKLMATNSHYPAFYYIVLSFLDGNIGGIINFILSLT